MPMMEIEHTENPGPPILPSWERRDELGIWQALSDTLREYYADATGMFQRMPLEGELIGPALFVMVVHMLITAVYLAIWGVVSLAVLSSKGSIPFLTSGNMTTLAMRLVYPFLLPISGLVVAACAHFFLRWFTQKEFTYTATARVILYAMGAANLLCIIPCVGLILYWPWFLFTAASGLSVVHGTTFKKATIAMVFSLAGSVTCCATQWFGERTFRVLLTTLG